MDHKILKMMLTYGIVLLFFVSLFVPITYSQIWMTDNELKFEKNDFEKLEKHNYPEYWSPEKSLLQRQIDLIDYNQSSNSKNNDRPYFDNDLLEKKFEVVGNIIDSPWPMYCHDTKHTGRSPYSTANTNGVEKWRFICDWRVKGGAIIDENNTIYFGSYDHNVYALYSNGTLKWKNDNIGVVYTAPAIDKNGVIYIGTIWGSPNYLYALNSSNGILNWIYYLGDSSYSSPAVGEDGTIYISEGKTFHAVHSNGTRKWTFSAGDIFLGSSPAIDDDGIVYCGAHDDNLYAWYPNNGSVKWIFDAGTWIHGSPTIGEDGVIYLAADNGLYALYSNNGTMKWHNNIGPIWASPTLDENGNIYAGTWTERFYAIYPNGEVKWRYDAPGRIWFGNSAAISADGTIYFGTTWMDGGEGAFIALNKDGTEKWLDDFGLYESSPAIGKDGTIYICNDYGDDGGCLRAFGELDSNAPEAPSIDGETNGEAGVEYEHTFSTTDPNDDDIYYYIEWGDGEFEDWFGPYDSGEEVVVSHTWDEQDTYTIRARAKDTDNLWGPWGELEVTMPVNQHSYSFPLLQRLLERFPNMFPILRYLIEAQY